MNQRWPGPTLARIALGLGAVCVIAGWLLAQVWFVGGALWLAGVALAATSVIPSFPRRAWAVTAATVLTGFWLLIASGFARMWVV